MNGKSSLPASWWIAIAIIFGISIYVQSNIFLSWDVGWHLLDTQRLLQGGNYLHDFFDINPPMIFYTLIPPAVLHHLTSWNIAIIFRVYIFLIAALSLFICYKLSQRIFPPSDSFTHGAFLLSLAIIFTLFPAYEFGQRDPFILLLVAPYFLNIVCCSVRKKIHSNLCIGIGILAGLGFSFNLQFLLIFIALEIYLITKSKSIRSALRLDSLIIIAIVILYILSILIFFQAYISKILPFIFFLYLSNFNYSWLDMLTNPTSLSWLFASIFMIISWNKESQKSLLLVLYIAATGFFCLFLATRKIWYYHMVPCLAFSSLILAIFFAKNIKQLILDGNKKSKAFWVSITKIIVLYGIIIWLPIVTFIDLSYMAIKAKSNPNTVLNRLIYFVKYNTKKNQSIFVFSTTVTPGGILIHYADVNLGSRFAGFWMLPGILERSKQPLSLAKQTMLERSKQFMINAVITDFNRYQPKLVLVDIAKQKYYFPRMSFNYIEYFSQNPIFRKIWEHYKYVTQIGNFAIYADTSKAIIPNQ